MKERSSFWFEKKYLMLYGCNFLKKYLNKLLKINLKTRYFLKNKKQVNEGKQIAHE